MADATASFVLTAHDRTGAAVASAQRGLKNLTTSVRGIRSLFAGFGVALSGRALVSWMSAALDVQKLTAQQVKDTEEARAAFAAYKSNADDLARSFADVLTPAINNVAISMGVLRRAFLPNEQEKLNEQLDLTARQINALITDIEQTQGRVGKTFLGITVDPGAAQAVENLKRQLDELIQKRDKLLNEQEGRDRLVNPISEEEARAVNALITDINRQYARHNMITQDEVVRLEEFIHAMNQREPFITTEEVIALEEFLNELNAVPERLTQEEWIDLESFIYDLNNMEQEALFSAQEIGASFKSAFDGWLIDGERGFKDLLKRMAIAMTTSALFKGLGSLFPGGSFFSNFFGGFRAEGGPVSSGKAYVVGEKGPEWFVPGQSGMIAANAGGTAVTLYQTNTFHGGDTRQQEAAIARNNARLKQEIKAELVHARTRGR